MDYLPTAVQRLRFALAAAALAGGAVAGPSAADIQVVASIKPVHSLVSAVMAGIGKSHLLMRGKASPHTFTLRPSDAVALEDANVVFLIDETMEVSLAHAVEALAGKARVVMLADAKGLIRLPLREGGAFAADPRHRPQKGYGDHEGEERVKRESGAQRDHGHGEFDMHVWLDPVNGGTMTRAIADALSEADPANTAKYEANARGLLPRLDALTAQISVELAAVRDKPFVVFHDGYRYFEDRFGLNAVGSVVVSLERSPSAKRLRQLRAKVRELGVTCVFAEPQFNKRIVNIVVEGIGVRARTVDPLGAAVEDGPELYFTLLRNMAAAFRSCLSPAV